ncbi:MAG: recombinase family protein [Ruminococcus sp.]
MTETSVSPPKKVRVIEPTVKPKATAISYRQLRVAAYCRVSTQMEEQLNSYEVQKNYYTEKINSEPKWKLVGIFADKGITGTSALKRDEFQKMIRMCKRKQIDMIITKSISRFSRNTVDCLNYVRMLRQLDVDVFFEEQGIHSKDAGAEFYITIYGSIAQSESENISANVRWGIQQRAKEGKVHFAYSRFLGYKEGPDGKPMIDEEQADTVKFIFNEYLLGSSLADIAKSLTAKGIKTPSGKSGWNGSTVRTILSNEKYKGDALLNKTYISDCISKKVKKNNGERPMYYIENNHPAIIDKDTFNRVQEELARRTSKRKVKQVGTKTEQGKYSSKYALTELLICGECGTPYRRCTWTASGAKKIVWRCINRLDYGKKYCHHSPTIEESVLQNAIVTAIMNNAQQSADVLSILKEHIRIGIQANEVEDNSLELLIEIAKLDEKYNELFNKMTADTEDIESIENQLIEIISKKHLLQAQVEEIKNERTKRENAQSRLEQIYLILDGLKNHPMTYNDTLVRQILDTVVVESKERIKVVFTGGYEAEQEL